MHYKITTVNLTGKPQFTIKSAASEPLANISRLGKSYKHKKKVYAGADPCDFIEEMGERIT